MLERLQNRGPSDWGVYIVRCGDGTLYTGTTNDLGERLRKHNAGKGAKYTRSRLPVAVAWSHRARTESSARKREAGLKRLSKREKEKLAAPG